MRKIVTWILLFSASVFTLGGCQALTSGEEEEITLTLWYWNRSLDDQILKEVEEAFPNIRLDAQKIGGDEYKTKLQTALIAGTGGPDIIAMNDWVYEFLPYDEEFVNLNDYGAKEIENDFLDWKWELAQNPESGALIALPIDTGPTALFYRADLFEAAGLPSEPDEVSEQIQTWDDYIAAGEQMLEATGVKMFDTINRVYTQYLEQNATKYFDEDEQYIGTGGTVKEAWDVISEISERDLTARLTDGQERNAALNNGDVASFVGAVWESNILQDSRRIRQVNGGWHGRQEGAETMAAPFSAY